MKMANGSRILLIGCLLAACLAGAATAATLGNEWKERAPEEGPYQGIIIVPDASLIFAGGNNIYIRSWDHTVHWGYRPAQAADLSLDGKRVVLGEGAKVAVYGSSGIENWTRNMDGYVRAVAISPNGSFVIAADEKGNYLSWNRNGEYGARTQNDTAKALAYSPGSDLIVAVTDKGLRFYNRKLDVVWYDNRTESRDQFVSISGDGSTVIVAGYREVASYQSDGTLNWRSEVSKEPIIDMDCSFDCSVIVLGGQDKEVVAIDRTGTIRWRYGTGQWVNAVGVSRDGSVIAAGGIDRTLTVLDRSGTVVTSKKTDAIIQLRSIAVSSDGRKFVVADQMNLYGFSLIGDTIAPDLTVTYTQEPLNPVPTTNPTPVPTPTATTSATTTAPVTTSPAAPARPTTYSPADPLLLLPALAAACLIVRMQR
jgi:WD40 repeat protein